MASSNRGTSSILLLHDGSSTVRRFTDFLVYEVDQDSNIIHIKSLGIPAPIEKKPKNVAEPTSGVNADAHLGAPSVKEGTETALETEVSAKALDKIPGEESKPVPSTEPWPDSFSTSLAPFLSKEKIE